MKVLGISAFYHDSAAALVDDGNVIFAAEEERFSRVKHDNRFPSGAIDACFRETGFSIEDIDVIAFYEKPLRKFERALIGFMDTFPMSLPAFLRTLPEWLGARLDIQGILRRELGYAGPVCYIPHHESHAANAYYGAGAPDSGVLTVDGVGEYQTTALWVGEAGRLRELGSLHFPHSLGLFYSTFTAFLGFAVNDGEYKLMALAAYGKPVYADLVRKTIESGPDGSFSLNMRYFSFHYGSRMWSRAFTNLFGEARKPGAPITERHKNVAASVQYVFEEIYIALAREACKRSGKNDICLSGGAILNAVANGKLYSGAPVRRIFPAGPAGDGGSALGAAYAAYAEITSTVPNPLSGLLLGTSYDDDEIEEVILESGLPYKRFGREQLVEQVAKLLASEKIVGWFQGRMEFGPRALGARSILAISTSTSLAERLESIKSRENFRPFAVSMLKESIGDYIDLPGSDHSFPFMNICFPVREHMRDTLCGVTHVDGTTRLQTVDKANGLYHDLIMKVANFTNVPAVLNTSFNRAGEPIVESPKDALTTFKETKIDYLAIGSFVVSQGTNSFATR